MRRCAGIGEHGKKNDRIDAERLALALEHGRPALAHVLGDDARELRELQEMHRALVHARKRAVTHVRGILRGRGVDVPSCAIEDFAKNAREAVQQAGRRNRARARQGRPALTRNLCASTRSRVRTPGERSRRELARRGRVHLDHRRPNALQERIASRVVSRTLSGGRHDRWAHRTSQRRGRMRAAIAVARRLSRILWALWRHGAYYDAYEHVRDEADRSDAEKLEQVTQARKRAELKLARQQRANQRALLFAEGQTAR